MIRANEFESMAEALRAQAEFPACPDCDRGVKYQAIRGRHLVLCTRSPMLHSGMSRPVGKKFPH